MTMETFTIANQNPNPQPGNPKPRADRGEDSVQGTSDVPPPPPESEIEEQEAPPVSSVAVALLKRTPALMSQSQQHTLSRTRKHGASHFSHHNGCFISSRAPDENDPDGELPRSLLSLLFLCRVRLSFPGSFSSPTPGAPRSPPLSRRERDDDDDDDVPPPSAAGALSVRLDFLLPAASSRFLRATSFLYFLSAAFRSSRASSTTDSSKTLVSSAAAPGAAIASLSSGCAGPNRSSSRRLQQSIASLWTPPRACRKSEASAPLGTVFKMSSKLSAPAEMESAFS
mmetsp:Transcript_202/g.650  ORF Transcript_202/g.650 Transcript_202/m.650 type:complete len:284 (+) Transcript_202:24-875(+)